jgi:hypothetical protein
MSMLLTERISQKTVDLWNFQHFCPSKKVDQVNQFCEEGYHNIFHFELTNYIKLLAKQRTSLVQIKFPRNNVYPNSESIISQFPTQKKATVCRIISILVLLLKFQTNCEWTKISKKKELYKFFLNLLIYL